MKVIEWQLDFIYCLVYSFELNLFVQLHTDTLAPNELVSCRFVFCRQRFLFSKSSAQSFLQLGVLSIHPMQFRLMLEKVSKRWQRYVAVSLELTRVTAY